MAFTLPPPPPTKDITSPAWLDWFFKIAKQLTVSSPDADQQNFAGLLFNKAPAGAPLAVTSVSSDAIMPVLSSAPRPITQHLELNAVDGQTILPGQIFGG